MSPIDRRCAPRERSSQPAEGSHVRLAVATLFASLALASSLSAQQNLSFEDLDGEGSPAGWVLGDEAVAVDATVAALGERSLKLTRASAAGVARVTQRVGATRLRGAGQGSQRIRLAGLVRTEAGESALWLRIDGARGPLFLDSYGFGREPVAASEVRTPANSTTADHAWRRYELELPLPSDVEEVAFGVSLRGQGTAWFDGLEVTVVSADSRAPATPAAARYLDAALDLMREHSLRRADVDWPTLRTEAHTHARGATTAREAHLAVRFAIRELGDRHSYLQSPAVTRALESTAVSNARTGAAATAPRDWRRNGIAYLEVPSFAGGTPGQQVDFAESLRNVLQSNDEAGVCGWVVDLRQNSGGNLWPMLAGLGPLLGDGELAASVYPDGRRVAVWYRDGQAGFGDYTQLRLRTPYRLRSTGPVAVLIGPGTASSAEVLAVAFGGRPGTRSFGAATRGLSAGNRTFPLADGASLVLTVAATSDVAGRVVLGPLLPDEGVAAERGMRGTDAPTDAALQAALEWLAGADSCS